MFRSASMALAGALLLSTGVSAQAADHWSVGAQAGTTGFGGSVSWRFSDHFALTAGYSGFNYDNLDYSNDDVDYDGEIDSDIYSLKLDYFPWAGGFFLSAGAVRPDVQLKATGTYDGAPDSVRFGGNTYSTEDLGRLEGRAELSDSVEPYLGLGWRNSSRSGLGFFAEAGAFWIDPDVSLTPRGSATSDPAVQAELRREADRQEDDIRDDLNKYHIYPVAVIGIEYTF
ncbi:hypothetical protein C7446_1839 [Kushneria sinocarnis]|uniref:Outer membrane protein with beta-barrel domain n=1 Tax=Kushneria sinocarnis TaxID=595502 RepID=A0A420WW20_9GAMM|nr:hypothetical protein [Kushneria sinocarnis]RKR03318.1 hypothetical protein C7446_1839 [Kushneria sinocarnis]